jgi:hypothetical protein
MTAQKEAPMRPFLWCGFLFVVISPARAEAPPKVVQETWDAVFIEGARCGYAHATVHELERDGAKVYRTTQEMNMAMKRYGAVVRLRVETTVEETADGKAVAFTVTQFTDKGDKFTKTATVQGDKLLVKAPGDPKEKSLPWDPRALGPYKQERLLAEKMPKPGDKIEFLHCEPTIDAPVTMRLAVKEAEEVDFREARKAGDVLQFERAKKNLLRVESQPDKVTIDNKEVQLPGQILWYDKDNALAGAQFDFGLGKMYLYRTSKEGANLPPDPADKMPDIGLNTVIPVDKTVEDIHHKAQVVYRVTIKGDNDPATAFARDARQEVKNVKDGGFDLQVKAVHAPATVENPGKADEEYLKSSHFIDSDNAKVKELAAAAVGDEKDSWKKALAIEKWVRKNMKGSSAVGYVTAGQVANDLTGDCRQHAMLAAAMCRAAGVPSRTAVGLIYVRDPDRDPCLVFHMWTEVWVKGQWLGLDATLGEGGVGPGHLKIADHSWNDTQTLSPVLPVLRVMGKTKVEVLSAK